jgi:type IV secretory pathway VirB10-like protein
MEQKNDNLFLGLAFVGIVAYFIFNEEKKKKIRDAKNSTLSQIKPIIEELTTPTPPPPAPTPKPTPTPTPPNPTTTTTPTPPNPTTTTPATPTEKKYKLLEDAIFWDEKSVRNDDGTYQNVSFIIPKDTIVSGIPNSDNTITVKTKMGNAIIKLSSVSSVPDNTTESSQIAFNCIPYLVTSLNPVQMDDYGGAIDTISEFHFIGCDSEPQSKDISNLQAPIKIMAIQGTVFSQDHNVKIEMI